MTEPEIKKMVLDATKALVDQGLLVEAGWVGFQLVCFPNAKPSEAQQREMRRIFFAGALHIFQSVFSVLDGGNEATEKDLKRMDNIHAELKRFQIELQAAAEQQRSQRRN